MRPHVLTDTDVVCWTKIKCRFPALKDSFYIQAFKPLRCHHTRASCIIQKLLLMSNRQKNIWSIFIVFWRTEHDIFIIISSVQSLWRRRLDSRVTRLTLNCRAESCILPWLRNFIYLLQQILWDQTKLRNLKFSNVGGGKEIEIISPYILSKKWKFAHQKQL